MEQSWVNPALAVSARAAAEAAGRRSRTPKTNRAASGRYILGLQHHGRDEKELSISSGVAAAGGRVPACPLHTVQA